MIMADKLKNHGVLFPEPLVTFSVVDVDDVIVTVVTIVE